ncbi:hypothetical protein Tco_1273542 [Tanacetum coccineum]
MGEDVAVHKELGDSLVRAATTASSLEVEQDNGNPLSKLLGYLKLDELMALITHINKIVLDFGEDKDLLTIMRLTSLEKEMKKLPLAKIDADHQLAKRLQAQEQEELSVEEKATLFQQLLKKIRKHFAAKRHIKEKNTNHGNRSSDRRKIMCSYLKEHGRIQAQRIEV